MLALSTSSAVASAASGTLTYIKGGNVFVSPVDGSAAAQVTSDGSASSPYTVASQSASGMVVAVRGDTAYRLAQSGQELAPPLPLFGGAVGGGGVSPDGRTLAYVGVEFCGIVPRACSSTFFLSLQTGLSLLGNGQQMTSPTWAGDAEVIGPASCYGVYRAAPGRGSLQPWISLLEPPWDSLNAPGCVSGAAASPDGQRMVVASSSSTASTLILFTVAGLGATPIAKCRQDSTGSGLAPHPVWSPDGGAIAWEEPDGIWTESIVDLSGSNEGCVANGDTQRLTIPGAVRPSWSAAAFDPRPIVITRPPGAQTPPAGTTPSGQTPQQRPAIRDTTKPAGTLTVAAAQKLRALLKGLKIRFACSEPATATATLSVDRKTAKTLKLNAETGRQGDTVTIATATAACAPGRRASMTVKPGAAIARSLRKARKPWKATLAVALLDATRNRGATSARLTFRR